MATNILRSLIECGGIFFVSFLNYLLQTIFDVWVFASSKYLAFIVVEISFGKLDMIILQPCSKFLAFGQEEQTTSTRRIFLFRGNKALIIIGSSQNRIVPL